MFKHIVVSGSLAFDRIMDFPGKFSDHILPDKIHILNVCFAIDGLRENFGGTAGNIAYALALLGERPHVVAAVGRDFDPYRTWMIRHHLPLEHLLEVPEELTAGAYITTDRSDNQITAFNPGAMRHRARFDPEAYPSRETIAVVAPGNLEDMEHLARAWRERGVPYLFDPGQSLPAWSGEQLLELLRGALLFISNDYELELACRKTGRSPEDLLQLAGAVITTRGEQGSVLLHREEGLQRHLIPAVRPEKVADPTGAGDAYRGGLLKGLAHSRGALLHACRMGATAAAYAVEVYGTQTYRFTPASFNERFLDAFGYPAF
ncbi:MAG TPA: carbohydrate kinase family protein [Candidatus Methanoperedens sp.]|nr:carbohydrate kinase family protein [Candidatus Methanoperedens sp.]